jgi:hypothetical protein
MYKRFGKLQTKTHVVAERLRFQAHFRMSAMLFWAFVLFRGGACITEGLGMYSTHICTIVSMRVC